MIYKYYYLTIGNQPTGASVLLPQIPYSRDMCVYVYTLGVHVSLSNYLILQKESQILRLFFMLDMLPHLFYLVLRWEVHEYLGI